MGKNINFVNSDFGLCCEVKIEWKITWPVWVCGSVSFATAFAGAMVFI